MDDLAAMLAAHNTRRAVEGLAELRPDATLARAAQGHADWMAKARIMSHVDELGHDHADRLRALGWITPSAENIALGTTTADETVELWMGSRPHRRNILNGYYGVVGFGRSVSAGGVPYWCAVYA